tara:strand:+ start:39 stop:326 length:288 start_codon:yes stop_codon:yes gene_type:complete
MKKSSAFKMKGFSGFGNSPAKQTLPTKTAGQFTTTSERETIKKQKGTLGSETKAMHYAKKTGYPQMLNLMGDSVKKTTKKISKSIKSGVDFFTKK